MIHIKIASDKEMLNMKKCCNYSENDFYRILESTDEIPFQDMESRKLIREIDHAERIEGDRYAMMTPTGKNCLTALSPDCKYGLTAIHYSRSGIYLRFCNVEKKVWEILADLPMDICIVIPQDEFVPPYQIPLADITENIMIENNASEMIYDWKKDIDHMIECYDWQSDFGDYRISRAKTKTFRLLHNKGKIKNRIYAEIKSASEKYPVALCIEKGQDDSCRLRRVYLCKYPEFDEVISELLSDVVGEICTEKELKKWEWRMASEEDNYWSDTVERYLLLVENWDITRKEDFDYSKWGFRMFRDGKKVVIEVYLGKYSFWEFAKRLKENREKLFVLEE